jgi:hypothetical protein
MSRTNKKIKNTLAERPDSQPYNVGYRRPPKGTRFQPGQSGNPNGRPKGAKNKPLTVEDIESTFLEETERLITVNEAGQRVSMTMTRAVSRSIAMNAASGKYRQQRLYTELAAKFQAARDRREREAFEIIAEYKIEWDRELARRAKLGITGWEPVPHPDQIHIDFDANTVSITGPRTREEKVALEAEIAAENQEMQELLLERRALLEEELASTTDEELRKEIQGEIETNKRAFSSVEESGKAKLQYLTTGKWPPGYHDE